MLGEWFACTLLTYSKKASGELDYVGNFQVRVQCQANLLIALPLAVGFVVLFCPSDRRRFGVVLVRHVQQHSNGPFISGGLRQAAEIDGLCAERGLIGQRTGLA